ncbi:hypothetical protein SDC9_96244 [bioreactor metagenome]|uniref:Uncharacterized protein n=1 Tax=bioreactor metagenome TaxID=1076179 RepID=A0A645AIN4_9ZZZZ
MLQGGDFTVVPHTARYVQHKDDIKALGGGGGGFVLLPQGGEPHGEVCGGQGVAGDGSVGVHLAVGQAACWADVRISGNHLAVRIIFEASGQGGGTQGKQ